MASVWRARGESKERPARLTAIESRHVRESRRRLVRMAAALWLYLSVALVTLMLALSHMNLALVIMVVVIALPVGIWLLYVSEPPSPR
jgi:hypothetical protein